MSKSNIQIKVITMLLKDCISYLVCEDPRGVEVGEVLVKHDLLVLLNNQNHKQVRRKVRRSAS